MGTQAVQQSVPATVIRSASSAQRGVFPMVSFEIVQSGTATAIQICCNDKGLTALIAALESARGRGHA